MPDNGNGTLKSRLWVILGGVILASIVGYGSSMVSIGGYKRQIEINTQVLAEMKPKAEAVVSLTQDVYVLREAMRDMMQKNDRDHELILKTLLSMDKTIRAEFK
jgi:hypothetical protein